MQEACSALAFPLNSLFQFASIKMLLVSARALWRSHRLRRSWAPRWWRRQRGCIKWSARRLLCRVLFATPRVYAAIGRGAGRRLPLNADRVLPVGVVLDPSVCVVVGELGGRSGPAKEKQTGRGGGKGEICEPNKQATH